MASEVGIANRALQKLGAKRIVSLTEDSKNGRAVNACYEELRDAELRAHTWTFATKRAQLAASATAPLFGKTNSFPLPSDFLRKLNLDPAQNVNTDDNQIEGRDIITDATAPLDIRYVFRVEDPNAMDVLFREALASRIAMELAEELTQSNTKKADASDDYKRAVREARRTNAIERPSQSPPEDEWVTVRQNTNIIVS
jgi:hypothetical protein